MSERLTTVTRKGQITIPVDVRRALGIEIGDKVAVTLPENGAGEATIRPIRSVADSTYGVVGKTAAPADLKEVRRLWMEEQAISALSRGGQDADFDRIPTVRRFVP